VLDVASIPGIAETGWVPPRLGAEELEQLYLVLSDVLEKIKNHPSAWPFFHPVDRYEVPDYYEVVKDPIDLQIISERLKKTKIIMPQKKFSKRTLEECLTIVACTIKKIQNITNVQMKSRQNF